MTATIRPLRRDEIPAMIALAATEGWNPGLADASAFYAADPDGFLGLFLGDEPHPAAVISLVRYGQELAFLGLYIARPEHRGKGLGLRLWQAALAHAGARPVGLDGVLAQQANYRRSGFELLWRNIRFMGPAPAAPAMPDGLLRPVDDALIDAVAVYDEPCFGAPRRAFLDAWLTTPGHRAVAALTPSGDLAGYGVVRTCEVGYKVGPLFADDPMTAGRLLDALVAPLTGQQVILDVPEPNAAAIELARSRQWAPVFETARMVRGAAAAATLPLDRIFGITSFELG